LVDCELFTLIFVKFKKIKKIPVYPNRFSGLLDSVDITRYPEWDIPMALVPSFDKGIINR